MSLNQNALGSHHDIAVTHKRRVGQLDGVRQNVDMGDSQEEWG